MPPTTPLLEVENISIAFGGLLAVNSVQFSIAHGELVGLIGPNGAGKTTVFNLITGIYSPTSGVIRFEGKSSAGLRLNALTQRGIARTFQNIRLFGSLSVADNVRTALALTQQCGPLSSVLRSPRFFKSEHAIERRTMELLELFDLARYKDATATSLPYGDQRRLEIVRALATSPKLLMLDEPACGMNPSEKEKLMELIRRIRAELNVSILLVEHSMRVVMGLCERIIVLDHGQKIADGPPAAVQNDEAVIEAYLGTGAHH